MAANRTDAERLDYLNANTQRLGEVYWRIENEGGTVREAIDWFIDVRDVREQEDRNARRHGTTNDRSSGADTQR